jgi:hypothetical protein
MTALFFEEALPELSISATLLMVNDEVQLMNFLLEKADYLSLQVED